MADQSKLLDAAEKVCVLFRDVVNNVSGDQLAAARALIQMTVAINELSVEVQKGKQLLTQLAKLKEELMSTTPVSEEKTQAQAQSVQQSVDPTHILSSIMSSLNLPKTPSEK